MRDPSARAVALALAGMLAATAAGIMAWPVQAPHEIVPPVAMPITAASPDVPDSTDLAVTVLSRPVFTIGRKPARSRMAGTVQARPASAPALRGTIVSPGNTAGLFVIDEKFVTAHIGQQVGTWRVADIGPRRAVLDGPGGRVETVIGPSGVTLTNAVAPPTPAQALSSYSDMGDYTPHPIEGIRNPVIGKPTKIIRTIVRPHE